MKYWTLIWLITTSGPDGGIETRVYESQVRFSSMQTCITAQAALDKKLEESDYTHFVTACEEREIVR